MAFTSSPPSMLFLFLFSVLAFTATLAQVPASQTFRFVNDGDFGDYATEYGDSYRTTPLFAAPYQLMWHNATPGQFYVGLRLGLQRQEPLFRWVWDANRGRPVGEKATLTFGTDGNLVLAEADGRVVWSTATANKGVVGLRLLPVGNLVLYDRNGRFVWQSFDHPTDTLFVGQSLRLSGPTKLVSRKSESENSEGKYSLVLESRALSLYVQQADTSSLPYGRFTFSSNSETAVAFTATPEGNSAWQLGLKLSTGGSLVLAQPKYNATISLLRLQVDGNLVAYTYNEQVDSQPTERTFAFFSDGARGVLAGCELPSKCGSLGVCRDDACVACPTPRGLLGWSERCGAAKPGGAPCRAGANQGYYKVAGVENFLTKFVEGEGGAVKLEECRRRCSIDCKCLGFFYWEESSRCWLAPTLGTLNTVSATTHAVYIKS